jgi:hypothetical protein
MDFEKMGLLALIEDHLLHGIRSGGPTGIAVRHLARTDATRVGMIGTGRISGVQLTVTKGARDIQSVKAFSRRPELREAFAREGKRLVITAQGVALISTPADAAVIGDVVRGMSDDPRHWLQAEPVGDRLPRHHQRGGAIGNRRGIGGGDRPVPGKGGLECRDFGRVAARRPVMACAMPGDRA